MVNVTRRIFGAGVLTTGLAAGIKPSLAQGEPRRGGTLVATWGGGEPPACYVPSGGGPVRPSPRPSCSSGWATDR